MKPAFLRTTLAAAFAFVATPALKDWYGATLFEDYFWSDASGLGIQSDRRVGRFAVSE